MKEKLQQAITRVLAGQANNSPDSSTFASAVVRGSWGEIEIEQLEMTLKAEAQKLG